ncbi:MAG: sporulation integral membrane protein YtvI [Eubacteriales bacterium]|jgi:sporulation integral membrane protein YtvI
MWDIPPSTHRKILLTLFYSALAIAGIVLFFRYLFALLLPFILAWLLATLLEPLVRLLHKRLHLPRTLAAIVSVLSSAGLLLLGLYALFSKLIAEMSGLLQILSNELQHLPDTLIDFTQNLTQWLPFLPKGIVDTAANMLDALFKGDFTLPDSWSTGAFHMATGVARTVPSVLLFLIVFLVASILISSDREGVKRTLWNLLPPAGQRLAQGLQNFLGSTLIKYLQAQLILMGITFVELLIGFILFRLEYALALALAVAVIDALPILGTGTVLIPWGLYSLITGQTLLGIELLALYGIILLVRQVLEPKVVGQRIGLHPLLTLLSIYVGMGLFGVVGMIAGPILMLLITYLIQNGTFKQFTADSPKDT